MALLYYLRLQTKADHEIKTGNIFGFETGGFQSSEDSG
jgi:hypothetical protein